MNVYDEALSLLKQRGIQFVDEFIPYYLASFGCHIFNLANQAHKFYHYFDVLPDMRLHVIMVAPPGFSKSFFLKHLLHKDYGLLANTGIPVTFEGRMTEAGWTGRLDSSGSKTLGCAEIYARGIVGMEEFTALSLAMRQEHSLTLEPALLASLEGGDVLKRVGPGEIKYTTWVTLWAGTTLARFDISGGLGRRFFYIYWVPKLDDFKRLNDAVWRGENVKLPSNALQKFQGIVQNFIFNMNQLRRIRFHDSVRSLMDDRPHFEQLLFRKFALGYWLVKHSDSISTNVTIQVTDELKTLMEKAKKWRSQILADSEAWQVIAVVQSYGGSIPWGKLKAELIKYGINFMESDNLIRRLINNRQLKYNRGDVMLPGYGGSP